MITVIVPWDTVQMPAEVEWFIWRQMKGPLGIDHFVFIGTPPKMRSLAYDHVDTMEEALALATGQLVFLDVSGVKDVTEIPKTGDITIVVGSTSLALGPHIKDPNTSYKIGHISKGEMFGNDAAAIALAFRHYG